MKTSEKAEVAKVAAICSLTVNGWHVSVPISEHISYDLVAERSGVLRRVQVKYCSPRKKDGILSVELRSQYCNTRGAQKTPRNGKEYDWLAVYNPDNTSVYFVDMRNKSNRRGININPGMYLELPE